LVLLLISSCEALLYYTIDIFLVKYILKIFLFVYIIMCAFYEPPEKQLAIFDPLAFMQNDIPLTIESGSKYFLRFPNAQNTENFNKLSANEITAPGNLLLNPVGLVNINKKLSVVGDASFNLNVDIIGNLTAKIGPDASNNYAYLSGICQSGNSGNTFNFDNTHWNYASKVTSIYDTSNNNPFGPGWYNIINTRHNGGTPANGDMYGCQIVTGMIDTFSRKRMTFRSQANSVWDNWNEIAVLNNGLSQTFTSNVSFNSNIVMDSSSSHLRLYEIRFVNLTPGGALGYLFNSDLNLRLENSSNNGSINLVTNDGSGIQKTGLELTSASAIIRSPLNMTNNAIINCPLIQSSNNEDIIIEGKGTGKVILKTNNSDAVTVLGDKSIFYKPLVMNYDVNLLTYKILIQSLTDGIVRSGINHTSSRLTIDNLLNSGGIDFATRDATGASKNVLELTSASAIVRSPILMNDATFSNRVITSSLFALNETTGDYNSTVLHHIYQTGGTANYINYVNSGTTNFTVANSTGSFFTPLQITATSNNIPPNINLAMAAGTGVIYQPNNAGNTSTNTLKKTAVIINSGSTIGSATVGLEIFDEGTALGRGLLIVPNSGSGSYSNLNMANDCALISRSPQNNNAISITNWNSDMRNGIRIATSDASNCSVSIQNGSGSAFSEFRMAFNRTLNTFTNTFNNPIDFNPTIYGPTLISSTRRLLSGLGTLSFTDISANSTTGSFTSQIYTDSSLVSGMNGMYYNTNINGGNHIFKSNDINGVNLTSLSLNGDLNTTYNRFYQEMQPTWNNVNGFYELAKDAYPALNPKSSGETAVSTWTARNIAQVSNWYSVVWASELNLFCATSYSPSTSNVVTSPDGITWNARTTPNLNSMNSVCWAPEIPLFVAVCGAGINNRVTTSPDGTTWTARTSANDYTWNSVCWSPELTLFVAVASSGSGNRIMTSANGTTGWTARSSPADNGWQEVIWAAELGLFVAVASSGGTASNRVMTSPNGITWTARVAPNTNAWNSLCWSPQLGLLVAVAGSGSGNRVMTSPDGINWTSRTSSIDNNWLSVCWSPELQTFTAVADSGTNTRIMTSFNGINWTTRPSNNVNWASICWSKEQGIFCGVGYDGTNRAMTSSFLGRPPTSQNVFNNNSNSIDELGDWTLTSSTIYSPSLEIRRNATTPLSRIEIVNDGANSSYIKAKCPSGQAALFFNTYNGESDDTVMNLSSSRIQVRRPIGFNYLTAPSTATQLGFITGPTSISSSSFTSSASERNFSNFTIANTGTYSVKVLITMAGGANHTLTECRWCLNSSSATFPSTTTPTKFTQSITGIVGASLSNTYTSYMNINLDVVATANEVYHINFVLNYSGGSSTTLNAIYSYTRIG
jgi:hypothetical protein